jgi:hypothetical protein
MQMHLQMQMQMQMQVPTMVSSNWSQQNLGPFTWSTQQVPTGP